ncbi:TadE/TadG family type IV pilus assembly protein [Marinibacterium profundimaris]|uniref:Pilus assembly protein TadE n=1 Tax=Marinibacterium profundimaris TaxID=1679460 RepID=A0A225NE79_9RHOB|nr:TadE/TadG family type IV pilus assembly protein [Marinibacterium profundimaris]OWU69031.1 pilus assembly protein TadE [Marinibacterium profundimaris]
MMRPALAALRRFRRSEKGSSTIEFAITVPAMLLMLASAVELGMVSLQHGMLESAMDQVVRDIRLGTGSAPQHDEIKDRICERAGFIDDCRQSLRLEMIQVDPQNWVSPPDRVDCTDKSEEVSPVRNFVNGLDNELMILRACAKIDPVFGAWGLGANMVKDGAGQYSLVSSTAFVQEPR